VPLSLLDLSVLGPQGRIPAGRTQGSKACKIGMMLILEL
jgi:hypothetical protein